MQSLTYWYIDSRDQRDQITNLCFQYLAIFSNEKAPNFIQIVPKWVENFAQNQINLKYIAIFKLFAKVVEFRQIWSPWARWFIWRMRRDKALTSIW